VPREIVTAALEAEQEAHPEEDSEEAAAWAYARRRRLGPYRLPDKRADYRERDLASLARQGFPYGLARRIVEAEELP
ncbi:MAG: RecX family transcriptional regulator, partial [Parafilimonas terrae]|nr:RecX family transcriptional regulator [Parafilimonas terrae]